MAALTKAPVFPAAAIEACIRSCLEEEISAQAILSGGDTPTKNRKLALAPVIDSLVVVEMLVEIEPLVPFELNESIVKPGGYDDPDQLVTDLLRHIRHLWQQYYEEADDGSKS